MRCIATGFAVLLILAYSEQAEGTTVYTNNFEGSVGSEWSSTTTSVTPVGARGVLGEFENETVTLTLGSLPQHDSTTVSFDLFLIRSWDGTLPGSLGTYAPDIWSLQVGGGDELLRTTFGNFDGPGDSQAYPDSYPGGSHPHGTGASEIQTLGYFWLGGSFPLDSVYNFSFTFPHTANELALEFAASMAETVVPIIDNESWGLDNVEISINPVPEPSTSSFRRSACFRWAFVHGAADGHDIVHTAIDLELNLASIAQRSRPSHKP